ncbi:acetoacetate--CoA ligase [Caulobacter sp.]|uniref:acetoacetate--CoA ligase n=1 Tax=Caulobacter sp. TaxID=78 RepID=UPI001B0A5D09|nr:acetoacetate--CoA ligase [Caulobacter sp.]MBO9543815.1 acetoacetate--CoA ligase [Caulobacter sp.]
MHANVSDAVPGEPVSQLRLYREWLERERGLRFDDYAAMQRWSTQDLSAFWRSIWDYYGIRSDTPFTSVVQGDAMPGVAWFEGARVNYVHEVFRHLEAATAAGQPAIVADNEQGQSIELDWRTLRQRSASLALELRRQGVGPGDRIAAYLPNIPEAVTAFLACASLGAIWTLCSPDMGAPAVLDRLRQASPKVLIVVDGVFYGGKAMDRVDTVLGIRDALPSVTALFVLETGYGQSRIDGALDLAEAMARWDDEVEAFEPEWVPFDHPLWILYSSGTTGLPKAIVHGHGGVIVTAYAGNMHLDLGASYAVNTFGERFHWYSATGWVMWNQQVGGLLSGTTICLFDGSPSGSKARPGWVALWDFAERHRVTWFGAGAAFYSSCQKAGVALGERAGLRAIRALGTTGSPLPADVQAWGSDQFARLGRPDIWWCNISGGTDIAAAFMTGNRELPATPGRLQCRHLGAAVEAWNEDGQPVIDEVGELVCTRPFPSMPLYFWGDADGSQYRSSYFGVWPGVWRHGDWLRIEADGSCSISGRSDATINRHGLRMGTAELYAAVERLPDVADTLAVDIEYGQGGSRLLMFVTPADGRRLDADMESSLAEAIRASLSPRFIPDQFIEAPGVLRTLSGKKLELPVKRLFQGWPVAKVINRDTIANPDLVPWYAAQAARAKEEWL